MSNSRVALLTSSLVVARRYGRAALPRSPRTKRLLPFSNYLRLPPRRAKPTENTNTAAMSAIACDACSFCGAPRLGNGLQACVACNSVSYCGPACQRAHWRAHRESCKAIATARFNANQFLAESGHVGKQLFLGPPSRMDLASARTPQNRIACIEGQPRPAIPLHSSALLAATSMVKM